MIALYHQLCKVLHLEYDELSQAEFCEDISLFFRNPPERIMEFIAYLLKQYRIKIDVLKSETNQYYKKVKE